MVYLQGSKLLKSCDGSGTVYQKQELLNQHKAVHPVLNSELRGSMTGEVTNLGNIQPAIWKLERPTRTMHEAQAANNMRRKRHFGEICTDQDALVAVASLPRFFTNSKRSNMIKEDSKASPNLILGVLDVKQKLPSAKQVEMEKDGKSNILSHSALKQFVNWLQGMELDDDANKVESSLDFERNGFEKNKERLWF
uniref:Uncharacterized protein n=1 Tax=Salix viminalis TaxID=40686 RepID=A0A6N2KDJ9_SALVM